MAQYATQKPYGMTNVNLKSLSAYSYDRSTSSPKSLRLSPPSPSLCPSSSSDTGSTVSTRPDLYDAPSTSSSSSSNRAPTPSVVYRERFRPRFAARAHLNIFTAKDQTKLLRSMIAEDFESEQVLYYYIDISTALQMNDSQMNVFHLSDGRQIALLHFDLHCKWSHRPLYGVVSPNRNNAAEVNFKGDVTKCKWRWAMETFLDAEELAARYGLTEQYLPKSSRAMRSFQAQLESPPRVEELNLSCTDWSTVQQIKSLKRNKKQKGKKSAKGKGANSPLRLSASEWLDDIRRALGAQSASEAEKLPMLPVVINKNNAHWVEWLQIVRIARFGVFVGISLKRRSQNVREWTVQSIDLDVGRIFNKHSLVAMEKPMYTKTMRDVHAMQNQRFPPISELTWTLQPMPNQTRTVQSAPRAPMTVQMAPPVLHNALGAKFSDELDVEWVGQIVDDVLTQPPKVNMATHAAVQSQIYENYQRLARSQQTAQMQYQQYYEQNMHYQQNQQSQFQPQYVQYQVPQVPVQFGSQYVPVPVPVPRYC